MVNLPRVTVKIVLKLDYTSKTGIFGFFAVFELKLNVLLYFSLKGLNVSVIVAVSHV